MTDRSETPVVNIDDLVDQGPKNWVLSGELARSSVIDTSDRRPPYISETVHFRYGDECLAAIVTRVGVNRFAFLTLFPPPSRSIQQSDKAQCPFDGSGAPSTWHHVDSWPVHGCSAEDAADARAIDQAQADRAAGAAPIPFDVLAEELGL